MTNPVGTISAFLTEIDFRGCKTEKTSETNETARKVIPVGKRRTPVFKPNNDNVEFLCPKDL